MEEQFAIVYDDYFDDVYRYVYVKTGNKWDAEDIVSETFRKAYEKFSTVHNQTNAKPWLMTIARNTVIDFYRKKRGVLLGDDIECYLTPIPFEDPLHQFDELECLRKSLEHLPEDELEIINLRYFANLKFKDVAETLKKPNETIRVKTGRITKKISILLKKCLGGV